MSTSTTPGSGAGASGNGESGADAWAPPQQVQSGLHSPLGPEWHCEQACAAVAAISTMTAIIQPTALPRIQSINPPNRNADYTLRTTGTGTILLHRQDGEANLPAGENAHTRFLPKQRR